MNIFIRKPGFQQVLFQGIVSVIIGALLILNPRITITTIIRFAGVVLLAIVFFNLAVAYVSKRRSKDSPMLTVGGTAMLIAGLALLLLPHFFKTIVFVFIGTLLLFAAVNQIYVAIRIKYIKGMAWINLAMGILIFAGAIFIILNPNRAAYATVRLIGVFILLHGVSQLFLSNRVRKYKPANQGEIEDVDYTEV